MAFADVNPVPPGIALLQRSLERGRLGHAYLFSGDTLDALEPVARTLAQTLNCLAPPRRAASGVALDCCDACVACRKIGQELHADVRWLRPESKLRQIRVAQIRDLLASVYLKPTEGRHKVAIVAGAECLNAEAANAFLKTLEEPPDRCVLLLLTTDPSRVLETIRSRCLRLSLGGAESPVGRESALAWVRSFAENAAAAPGDLLARYRLLGQVLAELERQRAEIERQLTAHSPLERYDDLDPGLEERWKTELAAAIEAENRRQRAELLTALHWWLRDVWLTCQGLETGRLRLPELSASTRAVASRLAPPAATANLQLLERTQRLLATNVQEALALEVGFLRLQL